jgi:hypothetical protein
MVRVSQKPVKCHIDVTRFWRQTLASQRHGEMLVAIMAYCESVCVMDQDVFRPFLAR